MSGGGMSSRQKGFLYLQMMQAAEEKRLAEQRFTESEQEQIEKARKKAQLAARGRRGTLLTGGQGVLEPPPTEKKRLLGE